MPFAQPQGCRLSVERRVVGEGMAYIKRYACYVVVALICGGWLCMPSPVSGEWFGDLYGGVAFPGPRAGTPRHAFGMCVAAAARSEEGCPWAPSSTAVGVPQVGIGKLVGFFIPG